MNHLSNAGKQINRDSPSSGERTGRSPNHFCGVVGLHKETEMFSFDKVSPIYFYEKGGMSNFTRFAASVLGHWNIRVNCIAPGGYFNHQPEPFVRQYSANTMLGRLAGDEDLKGILVFLASDASAYVTGTVIPVDGGYTAK